MSHYSRVKTTFRHREALVTCLKNLGYGVETDTTIRGHHGEHTVDIAVTRTKGYGIGFVRNNDGTYDMVADWWGVRGAGERNIARQLKEQAEAIQKEYARNMVLSQARAEGFELASETIETDGTIRLVMRRWD